MRKSAFLLLFAVPLLALTIWHFVGASYSAGSFSVSSGNNILAAPGATNILLGSLTLPTPATDSVVVDGAGNDPVAGDALSSFSGYRFIDANDSASFAEGEAIVSTADALIGRSDVVRTASSSGSLATFITTENATSSYGFTDSEQTLFGYIDADSDSVLDYGEDVVRQIVSGGDATLSNGSSMRLFSGDEVLYIADAGETAYNYTSPNAVFQYTGSQFVMLQPGKVNFRPFVAGDHVCQKDPGGLNAVGPGAVFWRDVNASGCGTYERGTDVVIDSGSEPDDAPSIVVTGYQPGSAYGPVTIGYIDGNGNSAYDCNRTSCEALMFVYFDTPAGAEVFGILTMPSSNPTEGITVTGTDWIEDPSLMNAVFLADVTAGGSPAFAYVDTDTSGSFDAGEDIVQVVGPGATDALSTGDTFRTMASSSRYFDADASGDFDPATGDFLVSSADSILSAGALDGTGTDEVLVPATGGTSALSFASTTKYFDDDASGSYANGDDIVTDTDSSGYYNADDLQTLKVEAASSYAVTDTDLSALRVYSRVGGSCAGSGTDTLLGQDTSSPFLDQTITLTLAPYATAPTLCFYADVSGSATPGRIFQPRFGTSDLVFASGASPSDTAVLLDSTVGNNVNIVGALSSSSVTATSFASSASSTYTIAFVVAEPIADGGSVKVTFPAGYSVATASMLCTENSGALTGSSGVSGSVVTYTLSGDSVADNATVSCTVSGVTNPSSAGTTGAFTLATLKNESSDVYLERNATETVAITSTRRSGSSAVFTQPTSAPEVVVTSPVTGLVVRPGDSVSLSWATSNVSAQTFVDLSYTVGETTTTIVRQIPNAGVYTWQVPPTLPSGQVTVSVSVNDLLTEMARASVIVNVDVTAAPPAIPPTPSAYDSWTFPDLSSGLVKSNSGPTVFYMSPNGILHPFFSEKIFRTWNLSFSDVKTIPWQELSNHPMGSSMPPAPGTILVKSPYDPKVYAMEPNPQDAANPIMRHVATEDVARQYFGPDWATRIIDVSPALMKAGLKGPALTDPNNPPPFISLYKR